MRFMLKKSVILFRGTLCTGGTLVYNCFYFDKTRQSKCPHLDLYRCKRLRLLYLSTLLR